MVIAIEIHLVSMVYTIFINNSAGHVAGVMLTYDSIFSITDSTFSNNTYVAKWYGVVIHAINGSFTITVSTFTNNSAGYGGVMYIHNSSLF